MELKILVVDDEAIIRNGIEKKIQRLISDTVVVGKAGSAEEAIDLIKTHHPHIVITDIRMPETDGLQFIDTAKSIDSDIKFVIISGYQEFEYARKALQLGVQDYLLKPIENSQLKTIIEKIKLNLEEELTNKSKLLALKESINTNIEVLKDKYLTDLIGAETEYDTRSITKNLELLDIKFCFNYFTVITIILSNASDHYLERYAISNISSELLSSIGTVTAFQNYRYNSQVVLIINHHSLLEVSSNSKLHRACNDIINAVNKMLKLSITIGIGNSYNSILKLFTSYSESYTSAVQKIVIGDNHVIHISDVPKSNRVTFFLSDEKKILLLNYIKEGNSKKAHEILTEIFTQITINKLSYVNVKTIYIELLILFNKTVKDLGGSFENIFTEDIFSENYLLKYPTLNSLYLWLQDCLSSICNYTNELRKSNGKKIIEEIIKFIDSYYYMDINLNDLASKYFINANYLSQLFKIEMNINFIDYLTKVRMEKAKQLLKDTDLPSYKISELVGYGNPRYFSEVFNKHVGNTPTKYRDELKLQIG